MLSESFTFDGPPSIALKSNVSWILKEPVLVVWPGSEHDSSRPAPTGQASSLNGNINLTLWAGHVPQEKLVIVLLQMTISVKVSSRKKSFDLFMILPSDHLSLQDDDDFSPVQHDQMSSHLQHCLQRPSLASSERRRLLRLGCSVESPSRVLMNAYPNGAKPITGTPLHLLLLLKSLSEMSAFDLYIGFNTYAVTSLRSLRQWLHDGVYTPEFDLSRAYVGAGGTFDDWDQYNREQFSTSCTASPSRKRPRLESAMPPSPLRRSIDHEVNPPPPYAHSRDTRERTDVVKSLDAYILDTQEASQPDILVPRSDCAFSPAHSASNGDDMKEHVPETPVRFDNMTGHQLNPRSSVSPSDHDATAISTALLTSTTQWVICMNKVYRNFYRLTRLHNVLASLVRSATESDTVDFIKTKAKGTTTVLVKAEFAAASDKAGLPSRIVDPLHEANSLVEWMYSHHLGMEEHMLPALQDFIATAVAWKKNTRTHSSEEDRDKNDQNLCFLEMFHEREATCIVRFYVLLQESVTTSRAHAGSKVLESMMQDVAAPEYQA